MNQDHVSLWRRGSFGKSVFHWDAAYYTEEICVASARRRASSFAVWMLVRMSRWRVREKDF